MKAWLLAISLMIVGCSSAETGGRVDPVLAALVPADTFLLSGIRMSELRATPLYAKTLSRDFNSTLDDFAKNTNFDIRKDVNDILIASTSTGSGKVLLARGNFKIQAPAGFKKSVYKGVAIYSNGEAAYAILDPSTAVAATQPEVVAATHEEEEEGEAN